MAMHTITVRIEEDVAEQLNLVAGATDRSKAYVAGRAIKEYLRRESAFVASVKQGLAEAERGEFVADDQIKATFDKFRAPVAHKPRN